MFNQAETRKGMEKSFDAGPNGGHSLDNPFTEVIIDTW